MIEILPAFVSFFIALIIGKPIIRALRRKKASQTEREEFVGHESKEGTPTMGGIIFIIAITAGFFIFFPFIRPVLPVLLFSLGFGVIGFIDDYLKVVKRKSDGFKARQKFALQILLSGGFCLYLQLTGFDMSFMIPFVGTVAVHPIVFWIVTIIAILGTVNGVNFTDGMDGLCTGVTVVVTIFYGVMAMILYQDYVVFISLVLGALLAFLVYNVYPAKTFMGDTGSLFLGGYVIGMAIMFRMTAFIPIIGFIYLVEVLSVIIQVTYFKRTGGKRIFRMAPIHHHFELGGYSETRVVYLFSLVTVGLCFVALFGLR